jgi:hypothetical protein
MLCPCALLPEWPHFVVAVGTAGLLCCHPQRLFQ